MPSARETSTQWPPGPAISSDGTQKSPSTTLLRASANSDEDHVHRQPAAAALDEEPLSRRHDLGGCPARRVRLAKRVEAVRVDADAVAHRLELGIGLHRARMVELEVPRHELGGAVERREVAHRHHVVHPVHADALAAQPAGEPLARTVDELLVGDLRISVLADVARLAREDDRRVSVDGDEDVCVAVNDGESAHVRHGPLEARVLGTAHERGVESIAA